VTDREQDLPRLRIVPVNLLLLGVFVGAAAGLLFPARFVPRGFQLLAGPILTGLGLLMLAFALDRFRRAGTPHRDNEPTTVLVTEGLYRHTRNPMYLAMVLFGLGMAVLLDSAWLLGIVTLLMAAFHFGAVLPEERYLERRFGPRYLEYKRKVRRWI
jgi:protein-S-isoprenylcysteine O-methyltransferase Ste14